MTSCAVHPTNNNSSKNKNGHGEEGGQTMDGPSSLSSSSSSSTSVSRNSTTTTTTTNTTPSSAEKSAEKRAKTLKSLIKKRIDPSQDFIKSHNKRVKFSETMQVFLYEMPDNQMPQIIALKSPAELNLMEFQQYMFEPPAEYQDFLAFEPPPDYRDFIANSLGVFRNEVTFDYIDDDDDDSDSASGNNGANSNNPSPRSAKNAHDKKSHINSLLVANAGDHTGQSNSKWQSMILGNNLDSLEEEQIIGVLKEDDILQAIGSQISLPTAEAHHNGGHSQQQMNGGDQLDQQAYHERAKGHYAFEVLDGMNDQQHQHHHISYDEHLSSEDFPVHHQLNSYLLNAGHLDEEDDDEACCIDGSSPNGSLQDLASDSSITSQDTIILINQQQLQQQHNNNNNNNNNKSFSVEDNIYENVQNRSNGELGGLLSAGGGNGLHFEEGGKRTPDSLPPDKTTDGGEMTGKGGSAPADAVLYENTSELMATVNAAGSSSSANVNHSSSSAEASSSASEGAGGSEQQSLKNNQQQQHSIVSKFRQNLMFYESMMQQNAATATAIAAASSATAAAAASSSSSSSSSSIPLNNVNSKHVPNENGRPVGGGGGGATAGQTALQQQQQQRTILATGDGAAAAASHLIPVRFPLYTIVDANRASSSSSLSSTSSFTSSLVCTNANSHNNAPQTLSVMTNIGQQQQQQQQAHQLSTSPTQQLHQVSPNSSSTSSSSSSGNMPHEYLLQYGGQRPAMLVSGKMLAEAGCTPAQLSININASNNSVNSSNAPGNNNSNSNNNFTVPSSSLSNESVAGMSNGPYVSHVNMSIPPRPQTQPQQQQPQQLSPRPPGPQICLVNNNGSVVGPNGQPLHHHLTTTSGTAIRSGQVVYRYPYAFIQHSAANGVQTIRPVQYILQTNPQTGAQSVIYNPRQIVINSNSVNINNSQQAPSSSGANGAPGSSTSPNNNNNNNPPGGGGNGQQTAPAQMMTLSGAHGVPIQGDQHSAVSIPVRRILVPQGTVLAPRIMHFHTAAPHPQHLQQQQQQQQQQQSQQQQQQNKPPPPYQYYVQQRHQQAVFAYQQHPNGPLRAPTPTPGQIHTVDVNSNQHQQLHGGHTDFPNPSEIRRRDGLYAYPQVLLKAEEAGKGASAGTSQMGGNDLNAEERDELEEFVQQEQQRTDRIKKRYSYTEDDDPTFGFARRPSVRGIRPKFGTTSEIIQQMTGSGTLPKGMGGSQQAGGMQQKLIAMSVGPQQQQQLHQQQGQSGGNHTIFAYGTIPKNAQFINLNHAVGQPVAMGGPHGPQMISIVKQMGEVQLSDNGPSGQQQQQQQQMHQLGKSQTLPRQLQATPSMNKTSMPNGEALICMDANGGAPGMANHASATLSRDQLKLQLQKQLERQMQQQKQQQQQQQHQQKQTVLVSRVALPPGAQVLAPRPLSGDEGVRGVPEGSSFSPNHPSGSAEMANAAGGGVPFGGKPDSKGVNLVDGKAGNADMAPYYSLNV